MTAAVLGAGAVLALLVLATGRKKGGAMVTEKTPGILDSLTPKARAAADALALLAEAEGLPPIVWTSGRRSARSQAAAMIYKVNAGENIRKIYTSAGPTLDRLFAVPMTVDDWAPILEAAPISAHQRGDGADLRRWDMTAAELRRMQELAIEAGWRRTLLERDHLHLQL